MTDFSGMFRTGLILLVGMMVVISTEVPVATATEWTASSVGSSIDDTTDWGGADPITTGQFLDNLALNDGEPVEVDSSTDGAPEVIELIVRFEELPDRGELEHTDVVSSLQTHAEATQQSFKRFVASTDGIELVRSYWITNSVVVVVDTTVIPFSSIATRDGVTEIQPNREISVTVDLGRPGLETTNAFVTSDRHTYGLEQLNVPAVWDTFNSRGDGVTVAVLDTRVDPDHQDIEVAIWKDFSENPSVEPMDYERHGTHVSGTVVGGNASGIHIGVAPDTTLMHGAILTECDEFRCFGRDDALIAGIEWAVEHHADVISLSLGKEGYASSHISAIQNAKAAGTVVVASVGNTGEGSSTSPGNIFDVIAVGASNEQEETASFSSGEEINTVEAWGPDGIEGWPATYIVPDVIAPGVSVKSTVPGDDYATFDGTSMAAPHVSGVIALMQSATTRTLEPDVIIDAIQRTSLKPSGESEEQDVRYGYGIVDALGAVEKVRLLATVEGTVADTVTNEPITNATIIVQNEGGDTYETRTDAAGNFAIENLVGNMEYTVTTNASGYVRSNESLFVPAAETTTYNVSLGGDAAIRVTVVDDQFGGGIDEVTVEAVGERGRYPGTLEAGVYIVEHVPSGGEYTVSATKTGYLSNETIVGVLESNEIAVVSLVLSGDATISTSVTDVVTKTAIPNALVAISRDDGAIFKAPDETGLDGRLDVTVPGTGEAYTLHVVAEGYTENVETTHLSSRETREIEVSLSGDAMIEVTVVDQHFGDNIPGATVEAIGDRGHYPGSYEGEGTYTIDHVPSSGDYHVLTAAEGYVSSDTVVMVHESGATVLVSESLPGDATREVIVVSETHDPIRDASVVIERDVGTRFGVPHFTNEEGFLETTVPGSGESYTVEASHVNFETNSTRTNAIESATTERVTISLSATFFPMPGFGIGISWVTIMVVLLRYRIQ